MNGPVRSRREARLRRGQVLARLEHPGIVPVHDFGELPDGRLFYAMKRVRGDRLDRWMATAATDQRLGVFLRVCEAVAFAHAHGVIHRDLKPRERDGRRVRRSARARLGRGQGDHRYGAGAPRPGGYAGAGGGRGRGHPDRGGHGARHPRIHGSEQARGESGVGIAADVYALGALLSFLAGEDRRPRWPR